MKMFGAQVKGHSDNYQFKHKNLLTLKSCYMKQITCRYALCHIKLNICMLIWEIRSKVRCQRSNISLLQLSLYFGFDIWWFLKLNSEKDKNFSFVQKHFWSIEGARLQICVMRTIISEHLGYITHSSSSV